MFTCPHCRTALSKQKIPALGQERFTPETAALDTMARLEVALDVLWLVIQLRTGW